VPASAVTGVGLANPAWLEIDVDLSLDENTSYAYVFETTGTLNGSNNYMIRSNSSGGYANGKMCWYLSGAWQSSYDSKDFSFKVKAGKSAVNLSDVATQLQTAIRATTSKTETVIYDTDKFKITSATEGSSSKILKLMTPSTGTDISGAGATPYLDCATNATETLGTGEDYNLPRLGLDGKLPTMILPTKNYSTQDQAITAATRSYIAGSMLQIPALLKVGTMLKWKFNITKTAAGTAASTYDICFGLAGTTADTARVSFTKKAGTAAADEGVVEIIATVRSIGATGIVIGEFRLSHDLASTGHATTPNVVVSGISAGFDMTIPKLKVGVCITSGASDAITIKIVQAEIVQL
jgi:hypothetical protein